MSDFEDVSEYASEGPEAIIQKYLTSGTRISFEVLVAAENDDDDIDTDDFDEEDLAALEDAKLLSRQGMYAIWWKVVGEGDQPGEIPEGMTHFIVFDYDGDPYTIFFKDPRINEITRYYV